MQISHAILFYFRILFNIFQISKRNISQKAIFKAKYTAIYRSRTCMQFKNLAFVIILFYKTSFRLSL